MALGFPCVLLHPLLFVRLIDFKETGKRHVKFGLAFQHDFPFPTQCLPFGRKTPFLFLFPLPFVIRVSVDDAPLIAILVYSHMLTLLSPELIAIITKSAISPGNILKIPTFSAVT